MSNHWLLRIGNGKHFKSSSSKCIWGINSNYPFAKSFLSKAKEGDILWFVKGKSKGQIVAVATFITTKKRELGPLIAVTYTNEELGWTETDGEWDTEIHYKSLFDLSLCELNSEIKGAVGIRLYNDKCKLNLPIEYSYIVKYSKIIK